MISLAYYKAFIDRGDCPEKFVEMARALGKADAPPQDVRSVADLCVASLADFTPEALF